MPDEANSGIERVASRVETWVARGLTIAAGGSLLVGAVSFFVTLSNDVETTKATVERLEIQVNDAATEIGLLVNELEKERFRREIMEEAGL